MTTQNLNTTSSNSSSNLTPYVNTIRNEVTFFDLQKPGLQIMVCVSQSPTESLIEPYVEFMIDKGISDVFNFCHDETALPYDQNLLTLSGIKIHHLSFSDGGNPGKEMLETFDRIINSIIADSDAPKVLFYCQAGMGRAPTMLAYLMMSRFGYNKSSSRKLDMINYIREQRRGAFNKKQLDWILNSKIKTIGKDSGCCMII